MARKILLADDSVTAQNMGRKILADAGYEVITVNNGSAALKKIGEQKPDLIVLDVYMPGYSGLEVCQRLKDAGETARIPVLLSVGKLEPFKTDEAKRVRADGYIIKPFEASELLSALSKLEDKIVPRAEASKPGRLARASAAIDEGRSEKAPAEDSGWKSRISFPAKKKNNEVAVEADGDDPAIYNAVNKDLRTVVDHSRSAKSRAVEEESVDLGALAPEGLPKDVTPEEIAALAAAAAQVQGRVLENKAEESTQAVATPVETADSTENVEAAQSSTPAEPATVNASAAIGSEASSEEIPEGGIASEASTSAEAPISPAADGQQSGEPATMAALVASDFQGPRPHWTVVAVDLAPEDAGISLEQEMQQAYAAYAATQSNESSFSATETVATVETSTTSEVTPTEPEAKIEPIENAPVEAAVAAPESWVAEPSDVTDASQAPAALELEAASSSNDVAPTLETITELAPAEITSSVQPEIETATTSQQEEFAEARSENNISETTVATAEPLQNHEPIESVEVPAAAAEVTAADGISHSGGKESDMAASTAAAWANWRRSRESGDTEPEHLSETPSKNAMAVAAGAESTPEEASIDFESDPAIASIVDSVLANLRPKIVEEISRKLGKKR